MRRAPLVLAALAAALALGAPPSLAAETYAVLRDWESGRFVAGAPEPLSGVNVASLPFDLDACPRTVLLDLLYSPASAGAEVPGVGSAALLYEWRASLWGTAGLVGERTIRASGYSTSLGVAADGGFEVRIHLAVGAEVAWEARIRGVAVAGEVACLDPIHVTEVEANPAGTDAAAEWVELWNPNLVDVDVSLWTVETTHGTTATLTLPPSTVIPAGGRLVVVFSDGQAIDNADESIRLTDGLLTRDATPVLDDTADDARTWQRDAAGTWTFAPGTPGS